MMTENFEGLLGTWMMLKLVENEIATLKLSRCDDNNVVFDKETIYDYFKVLLTMNK